MYSAKDARNQSLNQLTLHREIRAIEEAVFVAVDANALNATVSDGTLMTESTPEIVVVGTEILPSVTTGFQISLDGVEITFTDATSLNDVIDQINAASVSNVIASKDSSNHLVLTKTGFEFNIQEGTVTGAITELGLPVGIVQTTTESMNYFTAFKGTVSNPTYTSQMDSVATYFSKIGYTIYRQTNQATGNTFQWYVTW